jgi:hypothetical protein
MYEGEHVGYVPKKFSAEITAMIEVDGIDCVQCIVSQINPEAKQWEMCEVEILSLAEDSEPTEDEELEDEEYPESKEMDELVKDDED